MVGMRGRIRGVGNNRPVNASLCASEAKEALIGGWDPHLQQVISSFSGTGCGGGERTTRCPRPPLEGLGGGMGPAVC